MSAFSRSDLDCATDHLFDDSLNDLGRDLEQEVLRLWAIERAARKLMDQIPPWTETDVAALRTALRQP